MKSNREKTATLEFYLNGYRVTLEDPPPDLLLLDFLRSPEVALTGAKKGCGEGGCGACTVILSSFNHETDAVEHRAINSCLRPLCSLQGMAVTTIEGTGAVVPPAYQPVTLVPNASRSGFSLARRTPRDQEERRHLLRLLTESLQEKRVDNPEKTLLRRETPAQIRPAELRDPLPEARAAGLRSSRTSKAAPTPESMGAESAPSEEGINPVAHRLAINNGSQCGYCSAGFVMTMTGLLVNCSAPTKKQIEDTFDGNICRCTGYRPILTAMKTFASDWTAEDEAERMKCKVDKAYDTQRIGELRIPYPPGARGPADLFEIDRPHKQWRAVTSIEALCELVQQNPGAEIRLVHGNTSYGVYPNEFRTATLLVDIRGIRELDQIEISDERLIVGAGVTYGHFIAILENLTGTGERAETTRLGALELMARRTAGTLVRNAATLGGNSAMVLEHIHEGEAFPSDLFTALSAVETEISTVNLDDGTRRSFSVAELIAASVDKSVDPRRLLIVSYQIPRGSENEVVLAQKVALREVNAHSIVNATTRLGFAEGTEVASAALIFGGIAPFPFRAVKTEKLLVGVPLRLDRFPDLARSLAAEVGAELARWAFRREPYEGFTDEYRLSLALSFLYKAIVNALLVRAPGEVPADVQSAGVITWGRWPVSSGQQFYATQGFKAPVQEPYIGLMTLYQTSGEVHYTHEIQVPPTALNGALVQGRQAPRTFRFQLPDAPGKAVTREVLCAWLRDRFDDFVDLLTASEIPKGGTNLQGMGADQPLFAVDRAPLSRPGGGDGPGAHRAPGLAHRRVCRRRMPGLRAHRLARALQREHPVARPGHRDRERVPRLPRERALQCPRLAGHPAGQRARLDRRRARRSRALDRGARGQCRRPGVCSRGHQPGSRRPAPFLYGDSKLRGDTAGRQRDRGPSLIAKPAGNASDQRFFDRRAAEPDPRPHQTARRRLRWQDRAGPLRDRTRRRSRPTPPSGRCVSCSNARETRR